MDALIGLTKESGSTSDLSREVRQLEHQSSYRVRAQAASGEHSAKVLLVDDCRELLAVTKEILEVHGYEVSTASSAAQALRRMARDIPDIIICDVIMPERNGYEFHQEVVSNPDWCEVPFIFLTGMSGEEEVRMGKALGCDDYLTKPFDPDELAAVVKGKLTLVRHRKKMASVRMEGYRRRIIHTLSHEFRTPLVSINTGTELLLEQHETLQPSQVTRLLQSVLRGGQRLERLVDDFMLLQQIDLGHAQHTCELYRQRFPLRRMIDMAIDCFVETLLPHDLIDIELISPAQEDLSKLYVDVYDIQVINVFQRLLSNAAKFGGRHAISVAYGIEGDNAVVRVLDSGPGISGDSAAIEQARQPFNQLNRETYEQQGCGVGLTIAHYFTEINGGQLELRNRADASGLEARVVFPLAR